MSEERPRISVVVPTRDRPQDLQRCLKALEAQSVPVEIVVVEDAEGRGPAWARNEGVKRAKGEVICFTDDDCAPERDWAESLAAPILSGKAQVTAGRTTVADGATSADRAWETIVAYLQQQAATPGTSSPGFAATANLAATGPLLEALPFAESFPIAAGEDRDWADRATRHGARPLYVPGALALHKSGASVRDFLRQQYRYGRGATQYRSNATSRRFGSLAFYIGLLRAGFSVGLSPGLLTCAAQIAIVAGIAAERLSVMR